MSWWEYALLIIGLFLSVITMIGGVLIALEGEDWFVRVVSGLIGLCGFAITALILIIIARGSV